MNPEGIRGRYSETILKGISEESVKEFLRKVSKSNN